MRILVLQLARFGDVYQTIPTLNALAREGHEVHLLVRARFSAAAEGQANVHVLDTKDVLEPVYHEGNEDEAARRLRATLDRLRELGFDRVVNLSFSPFSSFVTDYLIDGTGTEVRGFARHADGYFSPVDDVSAYFYAQAGVGRPARFHVTDLMAGVAGVDLAPEDFRAPGSQLAGPRRGVVVHLGASQIEKRYPAELWAEALRELRARVATEITLVGSADERALAEAVRARVGLAEVINRAGETAFSELTRVIHQSALVIGADSAPVHVAALTGTPVLNVSGDAVNFWETGPRGVGSRVLVAPRVEDIDPGRIAAEAAAMLEGRGPAGPCFTRAADGYHPHDLTAEGEFEWALIQALYVGTPYPAVETRADRLAFQRLRELSELALEQLARWPAADHDLLRQIDEFLLGVPRLNPRVRPLTQHFETERLRIGPDADVLGETRRAFENLGLIASVFLKDESVATVVDRTVALGAAIAPALREFSFAEVEGEFHDLVAALQDLARRSTKVEGWGVEIEALGHALAARDLIELADRLEHELPRRLKTLVPEVS